MSPTASLNYPASQNPFITDTNLTMLGQSPERGKWWEGLIGGGRVLLTESNRPFFVPKVVSIGPYHHGDAHLAGMEPLKKQASEKFYTAARQRVRAVAERVRGMYEMDPRIKMDDEEFTDMLFLDACFVVHFISSYQGFVVRDLFLLENQLPYEVLKAVKPDPSFDETLANFICSVSRNNNLERAIDAVKKVKEAEMKREEIRIDMSGAHTGNLLDMLHQILVTSPKICDGMDKDLWDSLNFRSVKELKEAGIKFELNKNRNLTYESVNYKA
ncbi:hypothetical protein QJS04_geneDACA016615 [Acorus gramineus]|uniref:Uncharacterized protein n=1 Tax=Acorus gramineus TaxID=55184 RepID=A0AAV9BQF3_ACOGR|nr:hypothetical protein QJS04_geneDACA016615 [Acorus gramineus]